jgi:hypothetical protein
MEDNSKKKMTPDEMENDFKDKMFQALSQKNPGVHRDENGFIVLPMRVRRRKPTGSGDPHTQIE